MSASLLEPPAAKPPKHRRWRLSVKRYLSFVAAGMLDENDRVELLDGEVFHKMPIGDRHAANVGRLTAVFPMLLQGRALVWVQNPARMKRSLPEPDLQLLKPRADFYRNQTPGPDDILLIIEVAETSLALDLGRKARLYARSGVVEYWVIDFAGATVWVHRGPRADGTWETVEPFRAGAELAPLAFPDALQAVADLLL